MRFVISVQSVKFMNLERSIILSWWRPLLDGVWISHLVATTECRMWHDKRRIISLLVNKLEQYFISNGQLRRNIAQRVRIQKFIWLPRDLVKSHALFLSVHSPAGDSPHPPSILYLFLDKIGLFLKNMIIRGWMVILSSPFSGVNLMSKWC